MWNDLLGEMVNDLSKRNRRRVVVQEVERQDIGSDFTGDIKC